jgi:hypothetical protein
MVSKEHEGRVYPPYRLRLSRELGRKYCNAISVNFEEKQVPLTYMIFLRGEAKGIDLFRDLDIPRHQALHGGQRYEWLSPLTWNDEVDVTVRIERVLEKTSKTGLLWFVDASYEYRQVTTGELALKELTRLIKRGAK